MNWKWPRQLELRQQVGEGWLGAVYLAQDRDSPQQVYTRVLGEQARAALTPLTEVLRFQATAQHPHLLPTTLPETSGGETFYSMQVAERGSLRTLTERYRASGQHLDLITALDLIQQVGRALAFAHAQGVMHGNLKPENVLLNPGRALLGREGVHVLLSDFGLNSLRPAGRSPYLSPRQRLGEAGDVGAGDVGTGTVQDDLYGLGALLYFALSGQDPAQERSPDMLQQVPVAQRSLVGRTLGLMTPFGKVEDVLDALSEQLPVASRGAVTLRPDQPRLRLVPGEPCLTRVRLQTERPLSAALLVEGIPPGWVTLPPAAVLQAGQELTLPISITAPRRTDTRSGEYEVRLLLVRAQAHGPGELVAQQTLIAEVTPFHAGKLSLFAPPGSVGTRVHLELELRNMGNQTRRYALDPQLPPGAALLGSLPGPLTLGPGELTRAALEVRLPRALLRGQRREVGVVAHLLEDSGAASSRALRAGVALGQRPALPGWVAAGLTAGLLGSLALGSWQAARLPSIGTFTVRAVSGEGKPVRGEPFTLRWETAGARRIEIAELPRQALDNANLDLTGTLDPTGTVEVPGLSGPQTYTLRAHGWLRSVQRTVTVEPGPPAPVITALSVTPLTANYGEAVTVRWAVRDAPQRLRLSPWGEVPAQGQRTVTLSRTTTFALVVPGNAPGREQQAATTATLRPPAITRLSAAPGTVKRGETVTLSWQVSGARQVRLGELGTLPPEGSRTVAVPMDAAGPVRYVLKASNGQTEVTATAAVELARPQPVITAFGVLPQTPVPGQPVKVFWRTNGATQVVLRWGDERRVVPAQGQLTLTATPEVRAVNLVAQAEGLPSDARSLTVEPQRPARSVPPVAVKPVAKLLPGTTRATLRTPAPPQQSSAPAPLPVNPLPVKVLGFRSETLSPSVGAPIKVRWTVRGAQQVVLTDAAGQRFGLYPAQGSATLPPQPVGALELQLRLPQDPRPLARLPLTIEGQVTTPAPVTVPSTAQRPPAALIVRDFRAVPAQAQLGQATTLVWRVTGTKRVVIGGVVGPNPDGSFPPAYSFLTPRLERDVTYSLRAGAIRRTVRVRVSATTSNAAGGAVAPAPSPYQALSGAWVHSLGRLSFKISGSRVTGTLSSTGDDLPSGTLQGALRGSPEAASFSGYLSGSGRRVAVILKFSGDTTFQGVYLGTQRRRWCGGRGPAQPGC